MNSDILSIIQLVAIGFAYLMAILSIVLKVVRLVRKGAISDDDLIKLINEVERYATSGPLKKQEILNLFAKRKQAKIGKRIDKLVKIGNSISLKPHSVKNDGTL